MKQHYSMTKGYQNAVRRFEKEGMTTSDALGAADIKYSPHFKKSKSQALSKMKPVDASNKKALKKWLAIDKTVA